MTPKKYDAFAIEGSKLVATVQVPESVLEYDRLGGRDGLCLESGIDNDWYRGGAATLRYFFYELFEKQITGEFPGQPDLKRKLKQSGTKKGKNGEADEPKFVFAEGEVEYVRRVLPILAQLRSQAATAQGLAEVPEVKVEEFQPIIDRLLTAYEPADGVTDDFVFDEARARKTTTTDESGNSIEVPVNLIRIDPTEREQKERGPKTLPKKYLKAGEAIVLQGQGDAFINHYGISTEIPPDADQAKVQSIKSEAIGWKIKSLEDAEAAKVNLAAKYGVPQPTQELATEPTA